MVMWNEKILTTIPRDHRLSGESSLTLHWKMHFTELFTPSLAFDVKENAIASLLCITDTSFIIIWHSGGKPASWGRCGLFSRFDLSFKEGVFREIFLQKASLHSFLSRTLVFTVFCYNGPIQCLFKTSPFITCCGLDSWNVVLVWMNGFYNQVFRIRFWSLLIQKCL